MQLAKLAPWPIQVHQFVQCFPRVIDDLGPTPHAMGTFERSVRCSRTSGADRRAWLTWGSDQPMRPTSRDDVGYPVEQPHAYLERDRAVCIGSTTAQYLNRDADFSAALSGHSRVPGT